MQIRTYRIIIAILSAVCAVFLGSSLYTAGRYRATLKRVAGYQQRINTTERQLEDITKQYNDRCSSIEANNEHAKRIVNAMERELERNDGTIRGTIEAIRTLRTYMYNLKDLYSGDVRIDNGSDDNSGGEDS